MNSYQVLFTPAFDDLVNGCQHEPKGDHGRGTVRVAIVASTPTAAVALEFSTGWHLPETYEKGQNIYGGSVDWRELPAPRSNAVYIHSAYPLMEDDPSGPTETCRWIGGPCYGDAAYVASDEGVDLLLREGSEAVYRWLDEWVADTLSRQLEATA